MVKATSEYLNRPLRTEAQARAERRISKTIGDRRVILFFDIETTGLADLPLAALDKLREQQ